MTTKNPVSRSLTLCLFLIQSGLLLLPLLPKSQTLQDHWVECNTQGCKLLDPYYSEGVTVAWDGPCVNGNANGRGKLIKKKNGEYESTYEGDYLNGIREGEGTFTHKDASVAKGRFVNGQLMGYGSRVGKDGSKYEGEFFNYRQHGMGTYYYPNGSKFEGFFVSDDIYTGKFTSYDGNVSFFQRGLPVDKISDQPGNYKPDLGVQTREYFNVDNKRCQPADAVYYRMVTYKSDNQPQGEVRDYYITGDLLREFTCPYLDYDDEGKNFHEGVETSYYKNGQIQQQRSYFNNQINGTTTTYYEDGQKETEAEYSYGVLNGKYIEWYKNGKMRFYAVYEVGALYKGKYVEFDETGSAAMVYVENFKKNKEAWVAKEDGFESFLDEQNRVGFRSAAKQSVAIRNYIELDQDFDYSIECTIHKMSGKGKEGYGLLFGFKDWDNYFDFLLSENGSYRIGGKFEGMDLPVKYWTRSKAINTGNASNILKVFRFKDEFIFSINSRVVERINSKSLRGNYCGLHVTGPGDFVLENITVKEFLSAETASRLIESLNNADDDWSGNGSGFFINEHGYIATNFHVVEEAKAIQVEYFQKGVKQAYPAEVIVTDKQNDLAILKIKDPGFKGLPTIPYVFAVNPRDVGTDVFALGYPIADVMGEEIKFTDGKISSRTGIEGDVTVYQISVPIQAGNSGGPLFDTNGNLIGITSSGLNKKYYDSENVNYAIKSGYLKSLVDILPERIALPMYYDIQKKPLTEKIKLLSEFIPLIKVR